MNRKTSSCPDANRVRTKRLGWQLLDVSPGQVRAARGLLGWSAERLAKTAGVALGDLAAFEHQGYLMGAVDFAAIQQVLTEAGVRFIAPTGGLGRGVRLSAPQRGGSLVIVGQPKSRRPWA